MNSPSSSRWTRFLIPSIRDIIFIFLFWSLLGGALRNRPLADSDVGWHIRTGELILSTRSLPGPDPFSSTMAGHNWMDWEWLYDVIIGALYRACGLNGVVWLCALLVATTFTLLLSQLLFRRTGLLVAIVLTLMAEAAASLHMYARPHTVSWLFSLVWFIALERWECGGGGYFSDRSTASVPVSETTNPKWLRWFFPLSMLLWVNLHGGWVFGMVLLAIYTFATWVQVLGSRDAFARIQIEQRARSMSTAWVLSAVSTLINPYGWKLHEHIYRYLTDHYLMNHINEFESPDFHGWSEKWFGFILLLVLISFAGAPKRLRLSALLTALLAVYAGFYATRNLPVSSMLLVLIIGPMLSANVARLGARSRVVSSVRVSIAKITGISDRLAAQELSLRGHLLPIAAVVFAFIICLVGGRLGSRQLISAHFDSEKLPAAAVDFLEHESQASDLPIFSPDVWSGYLIYRLYPQRKVVMDDRHDFYGSDRVRQYLILMQGEPGWRDTLEQWDIREAVVPSGSTLSNLLEELPREWRKVYEDKVAVVWEKR
jgi:hypothetical protein